MVLNVIVYLYRKIYDTYFKISTHRVPDPVHKHIGSQLCVGYGTSCHHLLEAPGWEGAF